MDAIDTEIHDWQKKLDSTKRKKQIFEKEKRDQIRKDRDLERKKIEEESKLNNNSITETDDTNRLDTEDNHQAQDGGIRVSLRKRNERSSKFIKGRKSTLTEQDSEESLDLESQIYLSKEDDLEEEDETLNWYTADYDTLIPCDFETSELFSKLRDYIPGSKSILLSPSSSISLSLDEFVKGEKEDSNPFTTTCQAPLRKNDPHLESLIGSILMENRKKSRRSRKSAFRWISERDLTRTLLEDRKGKDFLSELSVECNRVLENVSLRLEAGVDIPFLSSDC